MQKGFSQVEYEEEKRMLLCAQTDPRAHPSLSRCTHAGISASAISLGFAHTCVLASLSGSVKCWGSNEHGQLGIGSTADQTRPADVGADYQGEREGFMRSGD